MQTSVTFKNLDPSENLKSYVMEKLDRFDRLLDNPAEANVVLSVEKFRHIAEININGDKLNINGKEEINYLCTCNINEMSIRIINEHEEKVKTMEWTPEMERVKEKFRTTGVCEQHFWVKSKPVNTATGVYEFESCRICKQGRVLIKGKYETGLIMKLVNYVAKLETKKEEVWVKGKNE